MFLLDFLENVAKLQKVMKIIFYSKFVKCQLGTAKSRSYTGQGDCRASRSFLGISLVQDVIVTILEALKLP